jgi:hypothetical protein
MYIDPNTGGMLFQVLAVMFGLISGLLLFFSGQIRVAFSKLRRKMRERSGATEAEPTPTDQQNPPASS